MSSTFFIKCLKDTEGWWTEGEIYEASMVIGGCVMLGDDIDYQKEWTASPVNYGEDGPIIYRIGGIRGEVLFEETAK